MGSLATRGLGRSVVAHDPRPPGANRSPRAPAEEALRRYWDDDAATYDRWREHGVRSAGERAAWAAVLGRLLPPGGAKVLDVGAGTGFLSLTAARMGYEVTSLDIAPGMLARLEQTAADEGLSIKIVCAPAHEPPSGPFDAVMERLTLWALPDPAQALAAWREVAPGRLIAVECEIGRDYVEGLRRRARKFLARARRLPPEHHAAEPVVQRALPPMDHTSPSAFVELIAAAGWRSPHLMRLRDVEWARQVAVPPLDRLAGVTPEYLITATSAARGGP
jgi:ubiquinone/menaquinone biosynthesis C-methylase UbiE